jgi:hypothetical protein
MVSVSILGDESTGVHPQTVYGSIVGGRAAACVHLLHSTAVYWIGLIASFAGQAVR